MRVNGSEVTAHGRSSTLLELLREDLGLTGTKEGCGVGECGACTVLIGDRPSLACTTLATRVHGEVETVEGLAEESAELRAALVRAGGIQCGFCTPGMVVALVAAARAGTGSDDASVRRALSGNVCRCTGYASIVAAATEFLRSSSALRIASADDVVERTT